MSYNMVVDIVRVMGILVMNVIRNLISSYMMRWYELHIIQISASNYGVIPLVPPPLGKIVIFFSRILVR